MTLSQMTFIGGDSLMGWQDIVVGIVIVLCLVKMLMSIFGKSDSKSRGDGVCAHCTSP